MHIVAGWYWLVVSRMFCFPSLPGLTLTNYSVSSSELFKVGYGSKSEAFHAFFSATQRRCAQFLISLGWRSTKQTWTRRPGERGCPPVMFVMFVGL